MIEQRIDHATSITFNLPEVSADMLDQEFLNGVKITTPVVNSKANCAILSVVPTKRLSPFDLLAEAAGS